MILPEPRKTQPMSEEHQSKLDALLDVEDGLRSKDIDFLDSIDKKRDKELSDAQAKWLDDLYERHC